MDFQHCDFISSSDYTSLRFIQCSVMIGFTVYTSYIKYFTFYILFNHEQFLLNHQLNFYFHGFNKKENIRLSF